MIIWLSAQSSLIRCGYNRFSLNLATSIHSRICRSLCSFQNFVLRVSFEINGGVLLCKRVSFLRGLRICSWLGRLDETWIVFIVWKVVLSYWSLYARYVSCTLSSVSLIGLVARRFNDTCQFVPRHRVFSGSHYCFSGPDLVLKDRSGSSLVANFADGTSLLTSGLLLAFLSIVQVSSRLFLSRDWCLLSAFDCLLDSGRVLRAALLGVGGRTTYFVIVTQNLAHAFFKLWLSQPVTRHGNKFFWP